MNDPSAAPVPLSRAAHAAGMAAYQAAGVAIAAEIGNRGPIRFGPDGNLAADIVDAYWRHGFYVFEDVIGSGEIEALRREAGEMLARAPVDRNAKVDAMGRPALGLDQKRPPFNFVAPLSDPVGGTSALGGRHPSKMAEPTPDADAPKDVVHQMRGMCMNMPSALRLYGHPKLLAIAEAINGPDFTPFNDVIFVKQPGLGGSVAWHQDGTTHWDAEDWDEGAHGFNFMAQLYPSTPANCVWVLPGTHKQGKVDFVRLVADSGSDRIEGAVPLMCDAGDVIMTNRQLAHGSFANTSADRRVTLNAGFFPRKRVLGVTTPKLNGAVETYTAERIHDRSRIVQLAIDARRQRFPDETPYRYQPFADDRNPPRWSEAAREALLKNYNLHDIFI